MNRDDLVVLGPNVLGQKALRIMECVSVVAVGNLLRCESEGNPDLRVVNARVAVGKIACVGVLEGWGHDADDAV